MAGGPEAANVSVVFQRNRVEGNGFLGAVFMGDNAAVASAYDPSVDSALHATIAGNEFVGNTVGGPFDAIGSDDNKVTVFGTEGPLTDWPMLPKRQVAERLWDLIVDRYRRARPEATETQPARSRRS